MGVLVLASASGAPGVTSTALGLTLAWPRAVVLVDADRSASQAILAGHLSGESAHAGGLAGLLQAHRERAPLLPALEAAARPLPTPPRPDDASEPPARRFVSGFTHLGAVDLFEGAWPGVVDAVREAPLDLVVDAGRTGHRGLPAGLVAGADAVGLVCRTSLASLVALRLHLSALLEVAEPGRVGLVLVGPGRPYGAREVADQFGVPVLAEIAWDPGAAAELGEPGPPGRRWARTALARSLERAAASLAATVAAGRPVEVGS